MNINKKVAIVILNWNGADLLPEFLPSVIRHSRFRNVEIIVADNGSTDASPELLKRDYPEVRLLDLKENFGFARGYNEALRSIDADYYVLLNSDVQVTEDWLQPCLALMEQDAKIAVVQPKIKSYRAPSFFEYAGAAGGFIDCLGYPFCRGRILDEVEQDLGQYDVGSEIFWASGACFFVRADLFRDLGGFDADFWAHMEEIDLCWRMRNRGFKIVYTPQSQVFHLGGGSLEYGNPRKVFLNFRNNLFMLYKNLPANHLGLIILMRMLLDGLAAVKFLAGREPASFLAVLKAHGHFYRQLPKLRQKRKLLRKEVRVERHSTMFGGSVMWQFFVRKRKTFKELNFNPDEKEV